MPMSRRTVLGMGLTAVAALSPGAAWARRERILESAPDDALLSPPVAGERSVVWQRAVAGLRVGAARGHDALTVFWLRGAEPSAPLDVSTLD